MRSAIRFGAVVAATLLVLIAAGRLPAAAAETSWASFEPLSGSSRDYTTTMRQAPAHFPAASVTSTSVGGSGVGMQSGASAFMAPNTPPGEKYGSSRGEPYLNLRPNGLNNAPPSVTTYSFERPTPTAGWTFVLGDVDADQVTISATDADGQPVDPADLGFRSVFNYCAPGTTPKPSCAKPNNDGTDLPSWDESTGILLGNSDAADSAGASAWFEPTVALSSLTFTYAQRSGSPVFQTWFAAQSYELSGTVTAPEGRQEGIGLRLVDPFGNEVATTTTDADGEYSFGESAAYDGYQVELDRPSGLTSDDPLIQTVDLSSADRTDVDFALRAIEPAQVSGDVTDSETGDPVPGATITLNDDDGTEVGTTTTDDEGHYVFDGVPVGDDYELTVTDQPDEYQATDDKLTFDVPPDSEEPIAGKDFALDPVPAPVTGTVSGTITDQTSDGPAPAVEVTATDSDGDTYIEHSDADGKYTFDELPEGDYTITVLPPDGTTVVGDDSSPATIDQDHTAVDGVDFTVKTPELNNIAGTIVDDAGDPVQGAVVTLKPPTGDEILATSTSDGDFRFQGLEPEDGYQITVTPPDGYTISDADATQPVDLTDGDATDISFALTPEATTPPTSAPPTSAPPTSAPPTSTPPTSAPPTSAPPTSVPPSSAEPSSAESSTGEPSAEPSSAGPTDTPSGTAPTGGASDGPPGSEPNAAPSSGPGGGLASTGGVSLAVVLVGALAIIGGTAALRSRNRRR